MDDYIREAVIDSFITDEDFHNLEKEPKTSMFPIM